MDAWSREGFLPLPHHRRATVRPPPATAAAARARRYAAFMAEVTAFVPKERMFTDAVRTFAYGTDASFYRLNPKLVVKVHSEAEISLVLPLARKHGVPVTFRAAGTSLSGQALSDSVLLKLSHTGKNFRNYKVHVSAPGVLGAGLGLAARVQRVLARASSPNRRGAPVLW